MTSSARAPREGVRESVYPRASIAFMLLILSTDTNLAGRRNIFEYLLVSSNIPNIPMLDLFRVTFILSVPLANARLLRNVINDPL